MRQEKGITLIALVITIIVLLILAGVTIAMLAGNTNAPEKANEGAIKDGIGAAKDSVTLTATSALTTFYDTKYVATGGSAVTKTAQDAVMEATYTSPANVEITKDATNNIIRIKSTRDNKYGSWGSVDAKGGITWHDVFGSYTGTEK